MLKGCALILTYELMVLSRIYIYAVILVQYYYRYVHILPQIYQYNCQWYFFILAVVVHHELCVHHQVNQIVKVIYFLMQYRFLVRYYHFPTFYTITWRYPSIGRQQLKHIFQHRLYHNRVCIF